MSKTNTKTQSGSQADEAIEQRQAEEVEVLTPEGVFEMVRMRLYPDNTPNTIEGWTKRLEEVAVEWEAHRPIYYRGEVPCDCVIPTREEITEWLQQDPPELVERSLTASGAKATAQAASCTCECGGKFEVSTKVYLDIAGCRVGEEDELMITDLRFSHLNESLDGHPGIFGDVEFRVSCAECDYEPDYGFGDELVARLGTWPDKP